MAQPRVDGALRQRRDTAGPALLVACVGQFMVLLDVSVVNVALPTIGARLDFSPGALPWIINAYTVCFAGFLLFGGRLGDVWGPTTALLTGLALFGLASLAGGLAASPGQLVLARAAQGIGGAVLAPATLTVITRSFEPGPSRARALAVWNAVGGAGGALGGLAGGLITEYLGWRWVLLINVPIAAVVIAALSVIRLPARNADRPPLDLPSSLLVTAALAALSYGFVQVPSRGWGSVHTEGAIVIGLIGLGLFLVRQHRARDAALLPLPLLFERSLAAANAVMALAGATFFAMWYFLSLLFQRILGLSPLQTGLCFLPMGIALITGSILSARLVTARGTKPVTVTGLSLAAAGFALLSTSSDQRQLLPVAIAGGALAAAGIGVCFPPLTGAATRAAGAADAGLVSGLLNSSRQIGGSLGLAVLSTVAVTVGGGGLAVSGLRHAFAGALLFALAALLVSSRLPGREDPA